MQQLLPLLLVVICFCLSESKVYKNEISKNQEIQSRQWNGEIHKTENGFGGWLLRITSGSKAEFICCGSYISPLLVLSSASCLFPIRYHLDEASVATTANSEEDDVHISAITSIYTPEDFIMDKTYMDIAAVRLQYPLGGLMTEFIRFSHTMPASDLFYHTFGWGFDFMISEDAPRMADVLLLKQSECQSSFTANFLSNTVMCAKLPRETFNCIYDGGSPVVLADKLIGVASIGSTCRNTTIPGVYTSIAMVYEFITETLEHNRNSKKGL